MSTTPSGHRQPNDRAGLAVLFRDATTLHQQGKFEEAARHYSAILAADPRHFDSLHLFGVLRAQQGQLRQGVTLLRRAIDCNPSSGPAHNNLGMTLNLLEHHAEAIAPLKRAIELAPQSLSGIIPLPCLAFAASAGWTQATSTRVPSG